MTQSNGAFCRGCWAPFSYAGEETPIASLLVQRDGTIVIAVAEDESTIGVYRSYDGGESFQRISGITTPTTATVAPRLYSNARGELILFASRDIGITAVAAASLGIFYSVSTDGTEVASLQCAYQFHRPA